MNELMIFIWVIGWMFTFGVSLQNSMDNNEPKFLSVVGGLLLSSFLWPIYLGAMWIKK